MLPFRLPRFALVLGLFTCLLAIAFNPHTLAQSNFSRSLKQPILYAWQQQTFGSEGQRGQHGTQGRAGAKGQNIDIRLTGQPIRHSIAGSNGEDGSDGQTGDDARYCSHPDDPAYNLQGADGGNGGRGGDGGNGGNGGRARIFYTNPAQLQQLTLDNSGGEGGRAGRGASGGYGCGCEEQTWDVSTCEWQRWRKQRGVADAQWIADGIKRTTCTGIHHYDLKYHRPSLSSASGNWAYRWEYGGVYKTEQYQCRIGDNGDVGRAGKPGQPGIYGKVTLIPRQEIPQEQVQYYAPLGELMGRQVDLVKNIWVQKQGLRSQLNANSKVPDTYTYLDSTARMNYRIDWKATVLPEAINVSGLEAGAEITVQQGKTTLDLKLPGTLDYTRKQMGKLNLVTITGGFDSARVQAFQVQDANASQLVLVDQGEVRALLRGTRITITCLTKQSASGLVSDEYKKRHSQEFSIPPVGPSRDGVEVSDHQYRLQLEPFFSAWLNPGTDVQYQIEIQQTTKSNAVYTQTETATLQVPI